MRHAPLILGVVLAGCIGEPEPDATEAVQAATPTPPEEDELSYDRDQGRFVLGSTPDTYWPAPGPYFRILSDQTTFTLSVPSAGPRGVDGTYLVGDTGLLTYRKASPWFDGKVMLAETGEQVRIASSKQIIAGSIVSTLYFLEYLEVTPGGSEWVDYCGPAGDGALPLHGYFDRNRKHVADDDYISFSCRDGTSRKCNSWGYPAGNGGPGTDNWDFHQACIGMTSALYCGDGVPYTREKTPILLRDAVSGYGDDGPYNFGHPTPLPGLPDSYYIESAWKRNGRPFCLSKFRWQALSPEQCMGQLLDPRYTRNSEAKFCDDYTIAQLLAQPNVVLVNGSKMMDAGLHRWRKPGTNDYVTTIRGFFIDRNGDGAPDSDATPPFPGQGYSEYVGMEGLILRNLPGSLAVSQMAPVYQTGTADRYLSAVGGGRSDPDFEGYAFRAQTTLTNTPVPEPIVGQPFRLCQRISGNLDNQIGMGVAFGCSSPQPLGFALPRP